MDTAKVVTDGTHRIVPTAITLARIIGTLPIVGVTRVAVITGLDAIGIPVVMVTRPNGRSLSVSQGKGIDLEAAKVSGIMEAIEAWHAENILLPLRLATLSELRRVADVVDTSALPRRTQSRFHDDLSVLWVQGRDLVDGSEPWVPYEVVHLDYRVPGPQGGGCFASTGSGLAAGNHLLEAVSHATTELIERDALTLWRYRSAAQQTSRRVDPDTVDDPICRQLLDTYRAAGVLVAIWDATSDIGLPVFRVSIIDAEADPLRRLPAAAGFGCHLARGVALSRALTEAAQSRLTLIAGSRDDAPPSLYLDHRDTDAIEQQLTLMRDRPTPADFTDTPTIELHDVADDVTHTIDALRSRGLNQIVMVDLTRPETAVPVVRMVIPGLEGYAEKVTDYVAGRRAMEVAGQR